jgi:Asp-tRNA(Asn)/Glu-tRNA(Gln) amidotransferase A subunit family amidase
MNLDRLDFSIPTLYEVYQKGKTVDAVLEEVRRRVSLSGDNPIWIHLLSNEDLEPYVERLREVEPSALPLYGIPFAIKDNIDLAGVRTTAACEAFSYTPAESAFVVERLISAGAIPIGKTNLDQFATGLVGTRSPWGAVRNSFDAGYIAGGSSAGSAVSVALGHVSFALGTDTAGSGRIPAAFNNLVGFKPTRGLLSTRGVVPACRTLDCISIFGLTVADTKRIFERLLMTRTLTPVHPLQFVRVLARLGFRYLTSSISRETTSTGKHSLALPPSCRSRSLLSISTRCWRRESCSTRVRGSRSAIMPHEPLSTTHRMHFVRSSARLWLQPRTRAQLTTSRVLTH